MFPGQWEFKTGPTLRIKAGDDLWMLGTLSITIAYQSRDACFAAT